ncbi:IclR family transcriptional regulator [Pleomorphomonas carboxyditropha]|uniref:IclR family transcriptional regulator n=1 Tax=Pleomorphomonas carboxyditropha TaxID=2023338 RepID=UPI0013FD2871|nr:IclR family transcriptional regulator [Pleomorphomonas carboxyditropha]
MTAPRRGRTRTREDVGVTRTLDRGLALLELLGDARQATLSQLARGVGISPTTASRLLETLKGRGLVDYDEETGLFSVGMKAFVIGSSAVRARRLDRVALPSMRALAEDTRLPVNLGVRDGQSAIYIEQFETGGTMRLLLRLGRQLPLHATAIGKVLVAWLWDDALAQAIGDGPLASFTVHTTTDRDIFLADLDAVRANGWATDDQEYEEGLFCVAAPIRDRSGEVVAGLSVSSLASRVGDEAIRELARHVTAAASEVSGKLGWQSANSGLDFELDQFID